MNARIRFLLGWAIAIPAATMLHSASDADNSSRPIEAESYLETVIPADLRPLLLREAWVRFAITIDADGKLVDHMPLDATHYKLLDRAEKCLLDAKFSPAHLDGKSVQSTAEVTVTFFDPEQRAFHSGLISAPHGSSSMDAAVRWMSEASLASLRYRSSQPEELDKPLELISGKILVLTDDDGKPAEGDCVIEYFIDRNGEVRLPRVVSTDNELVAKSALLTVRESRYGPVTRKGMPTYVKVRLPMEFHPSTASQQQD